MTPRLHHLGRGLTLLELMLALMVTAIVAGAVAGMSRAVSTGMSTQHDNREVLVRAAATEARLGAYIAPARCLLAAGAGQLVLWLEDSRQGDTVHASEVRWIRHDADEDRVDVFFISFPDGFNEFEKQMKDAVFPAASNWDAVLAAYAAQGWVGGYTLADGVESFAIEIDQATAQQSRHVYFDMDLTTDSGNSPVRVIATIREHAVPIS